MGMEAYIRLSIADVLTADPECVVQHLTDLDDDCLLNVFSLLSPLPDLISLSKACRVSVGYFLF